MSSQLQLGPGPMRLWEESIGLRDSLEYLPPEIVLESGLSARRSSLVERWYNLEDPPENAEKLSDASQEELEAWIVDAKKFLSVFRAFISESKSAPQKRAGYELVQSTKELRYFSEYWHWPWEKPQISKKESTEKKGKMIKYGIIGAVGIMVAATIMDED